MKSELGGDSSVTRKHVNDIRRGELFWSLSREIVYMECSHGEAVVVWTKDNDQAYQIGQLCKGWGNQSQYREVLRPGEFVKLIQE